VKANFVVELGGISCQLLKDVAAFNVMETTFTRGYH
jgi:hypothetical protein